MDSLNGKIAEVLEAHDLYWECYIKGDIDNLSALLDDYYTQIGSVEEEVFFDKKDAIQFVVDTLDQISGNVKMLNRVTKPQVLQNLVLVSEQCDLYVKSEEEWIFYSKFRASTIFQKKHDGWKIIHQHSSLPDYKAQEGENIALEKISAENLELREAVKRRTVDLENKNRELQIEAALEKVRSVAMGMRKPEDMLDVCRAISDQLQDFGVEKIRNVQIATIDENIGQYLCYQYFIPYDKTTIEKTEYFKSPVEHGMVKQMLASRDGYFIGNLSGKELEEFREHRKAENHFPDPFLDEANELAYCFLSIGEGGLGLTLYKPMAEDILTLFKRFHQVFSLAYQRFRDIQKAEAQAREAQIEAALEKVRALTMGMRSSEDVGKCIVKMFSELTALGVDEGTRFGIGILNHDNENNQLWTARKNGDEVNMHIGNIDMASHPLLKSARQAWKAQVPFHTYVLEGEDLLDYYQMLNTAPDYKIQIPLEHLPKKEIQHCFIFEHGFFYAFSPLEFQPELIHITKRFSALFEQTYRRYLDLVKAEAQAKEARIEAALERVRSRTMAMHHTEELKEVIQVVFEQFVRLNIPVDHAGFILDYKEREDMHIWLADHQQGVPTEITIPYFDSPHWNRYLEAKDRQESFFAVLLPFEVKNKFYQDLFCLIPELTEEAQKAILSKPGLSISTVLLDNVGLYIEHYSEAPFTTEENALLMRFGKVFQQTYTRFLDLKKAEAQAREAQIEAALERVRSRSLAMHYSSELSAVVDTLLREFTSLEFTLTFCIINLIDEQDRSNTVWAANPETGKGPESYYMKFENYPFHYAMWDAWKAQKKRFVYTLEGEEKKVYDEYLYSETEFRRFPKHVQEANKALERYVAGFTFFKYSGLQTVSLNPISEDELEILERFGRVFEQAYTRFLDLQKAEAQTREAQIEAALERVRSRSLAMHHSEEILDVCAALCEQLTKLGLDFEVVNIGTDIQNLDHDLFLWIYSKDGGKIYPSLVRVPYIENPVFTKLLETIDKKEELFTLLLSQEDKIQYYKHLFDNTEVGKLIPQERRDFLLDKAEYSASFSLGNHTMIGIVNYEGMPFSAEQNSILKRFSHVFNQSYTRFLDLEKAEVQARESEIQLALERVRARSLAMHRTEELADLSLELVKQVQTLGMESWFCAFNIYDDDPRGSVEWGSNGQGTFPKYRTPREGVFLRYFEAGQRGETLLINEIGEEECPAHYEYLCTLPGVGEQLLQMKAAGIPFPSSQIDHVAFFKYGYVLFITYKPAPESHETFKRFAKVFEQSYRRYLDLQKAEAQAREAKIEAALERVRSRSMAMHKTDELQEVVRVVAEELKNTGVILDTWGAVICTYFQDSKDVLHWTAAEDPANPSIAFLLPYFKDELFDDAWDSKERGDSYFAKVFSFDVKNAFFKYAFEHSDYRQLPDDYKKGILESECHGIAWAWAKNSAIMIPSIQGDLPSEEEKEILVRFAKVFEQSYIRFLDLQKAEAQAREAKIEGALEKIRSRTMGMQSSEELPEVANLLFTEVRALGIRAWSCGYNILAEDRKSAVCCMSSEGTLQTPFQLRLRGEASFDEWSEFISSDQAMFVQELGGKALEEHYAHMKSFPDLKPTFDEIERLGLSLPSYQINHLCKFTQGFILFITYEKVAEAHAIFKRFTNVFDQTYTRFLDLKKAEAQTREAQIANALEKVRSRSLAMQSPNELIEVAQLLREEMGALGVEELETSSIYIHEESSGLTACWFTIKNTEEPDKGITDQMTIRLEETWVGRQMREFFHSSDEKTSILMQGKDRIEWIRYCEGKTKLFGISNFYGDTIPERTYHLYKFSNGYIGAAAPAEISQESWDLLRRATAVFSFAYTRFQDLQRAEASARAAMRQASLDRIRADISSMRNAHDLDRITPLIFKELTVLGVPFIRCGVFIINEKHKIVEAYLSSPEGNSLGVLRLPYQASELTYQTVEAWRKGEIYKQHWNKEDFIQWIKQLMEQDQIQDSSTYQGSAAPPESLDLHFVPFTQGMLYVGNVDPLDEMELELVQSLAKAFSIAFARYEDFVKLEHAKAEVESAMTELKATQSQLVQQEKLASLGQLTAGIAHEIKNPLNFVNNFSEVSIELVDEAIEERSKSQETRDETLVDEILEDIKSNLKKVNEHGTRANSIVSSMLQHSRGGSGKIEPTELNPLIKEYVNLSFHGMRAGKNPIDVEIFLELDPALGEVSLIKEDFTRVIINLCNNAFDAMRGKKYQVPSTEYRDETYSEVNCLPKLKVSTHLENGRVQIAFEDNGPGIPEEIKDKILQPFFTTKKGTEGTGLGLSITHDIVKAHGGELQVNSVPGEFTTFSIFLPV